jgi:catechol 2,3-dioxygenase-like lactoylglutathione lyase family enzyme
VIFPTRSNTILYVDDWPAVVAFYRDLLGHSVSYENDWFVEFELNPGSYLSVAQASRSSVAPGSGGGITLSWKVDDVTAVRDAMIGHGVDVPAITTRFGAPTLDLFDPAGTRIELWSAPSTPTPDRSKA